MRTPEQVLLSREQFVRDFARKLIGDYSDMLYGALPDEHGCYKVGAKSSPGFTVAEKEMIMELLEQDFADSGWDYERTYSIFSYKLKPYLEELNNEE